MPTDLHIVARKRALRKIRAERGVAREAEPADWQEKYRAHVRFMRSWLNPLLQSQPTRLVRFTDPKRTSVWLKTQGRCFYCGVQTLGQNIGYVCENGGVSTGFTCTGTSAMEADHYVSKRAGGGNDVSNLVPSCSHCNNLKRHHSIAEFRRLFRKRHGAVFFYGEIAS